ncbi:hypothetical protein [Enterovirga rhinocerotis]|uniref:Uncharacterized protein n=1 Tax=Enterovirga rhinocerotis TaxID=1339210 RepID=A0A4R7BJC9_9HYPH|nr:hypothetical protein [Enterovirga rhinocerotis]TDR85444.1 hypothetical protein EV668_4566 [Enterovirga rhinocerotis]
MMRSVIAAAALTVLAAPVVAQTTIDPDTGKAPPGASVAPGKESTIDARRPNTTGSVSPEGTDAKTPDAGPAAAQPPSPPGKGGATRGQPR